MSQFFIFLLSLFLIVISVLMVVKFFQIAKNVKEITRLLSMQFKVNEIHEIPVVKKQISVDGISVGSHVVEIKTKNQMKVLEILNDSDVVMYRCSSNQGITSKLYKRDEIELFTLFFKK